MNTQTRKISWWKLFRMNIYEYFLRESHKDLMGHKSVDLLSEPFVFLRFPEKTKIIYTLNNFNSAEISNSGMNSLILSFLSRLRSLKGVHHVATNENFTFVEITFNEEEVSKDITNEIVMEKIRSHFKVFFPKIVFFLGDV